MKLPSPETYERELHFMPYRKSLQMVEDIVCADAPRDARVLDLMCGTGYLMGRIKKTREDLHMQGIDINPRYIEFAKRTYPENRFRVVNVLTLREAYFDVVLCTGALHHLPFERQEEAIVKIADLTKPGGFAVISDCYIDPFMAGQDRQLAAAKLSYEYLKATIENGAPRDVVKAALEIMANDVCEKEFKVPFHYRLSMFKRFFPKVRTMKTWPNKQIGGYGDYVTVLRK